MKEEFAMESNSQMTVFDIINLLKENREALLKKGKSVTDIQHILSLPILNKTENHSQSAEWLYDEIVQMNKVLREQRSDKAKNFYMLHEAYGDSAPECLSAKAELDRLTILQRTLNDFILFLRNNDYFGDV